LLKNISLIFVDQNLRISAATLIANFTVTKIKNPQEQLVLVATISNRTSLIVEPFVAEESGSNLPELHQSFVTLSNCKDIADSLSNTLLSYVAPFSSMQSLRVLPLHTQYCDNSYRLNSEDDDLGIINTQCDLADTALDLFETSNLQFEHSKSKYPINISDENNNTVLVHPLYIKSALDIALRIQSDTLSAEQYTKCLNNTISLSFLGQLFVSKQQIDKNSPSVLVRVILSDMVRPFHISMNTNTRRVLQAQSFDRLFLKIIDDKTKPPIYPMNIILSALSCQNHERSDSLHSKSLRTAAVKAAFIRLVDKLTPVHEGLLICSGQILTLSLPAESDEVVQISHCVDFQVKLESAAEFKENERHHRLSILIYVIL